MNVLVFCGTGAMGVHLVNLLSNSGVNVVVTTRRRLESHDNVKYIQGNAHNLDFVSSILREKWDVIIDFMVYSSTDFNDRVNLLLNATKQYIFLSSARVYANSEDRLLENSPRLLDVSKDETFLSTNEYALSKARQEDILMKSGFNNWTIIRPYITYSENRLQLGVLEKEEWLYRALHGRTIVFSSDMLSKKTTLTYGLDVSKGIMAVVGNAKALGEIFHISSDRCYYWGQVLDIYLDVLESHLGYRPKVLLQDLDHFLKIKPSIYQTKYDRLFDRSFNNEKIGEFVDVKSFVRLDEGLRFCLEKFLLDPKFDLINWALEVEKDKQAKECISLSEIKGFKAILRYIYKRYF